MEKMNFGDAVKALNYGELVARKGWNGKDMYLFLRREATIAVEVLAKITSLPEKVKNKLIQNCQVEYPFVDFGAYICMKAADNSVVNGWVASQADMLAEDWQIVE